MAQLDLFARGVRTLIDDARGELRYEPGWVDQTTAAAWFAELQAGLDWRAERRLMYERDVDVPRLLAHHWLDEPALPPLLA